MGVHFSHIIVAGMGNGPAKPTASRAVDSGSFYGLEAKTLEGESFPFEQLRNKVVLITNVASS